jgi:hypothetical protein
MTEPSTTPPPAGPETQSLPQAKGGGTYGQGDFTKAAQRSKLETDHLDAAPPEPEDGVPEVASGADKPTPKR